MSKKFNFLHARTNVVVSDISRARSVAEHKRQSARIMTAFDSQVYEPQRDAVKQHPQQANEDKSCL